MKRGFCTDCGGTVHNESSGFKNWIMIAAGILNDPKHYIPQIDFYTKDAQNWSCMLENTAKSLKSPSAK